MSFSFLTKCFFLKMYNRLASAAVIASIPEELLFERVTNRKDNSLLPIISKNIIFQFL